jgi:hypothetical protein
MDPTRPLGARSAGAALVLAPVLLVTAEALYDNDAEDAVSTLAWVNAHGDRWLAGNLVSLAAAALFAFSAPAVAALVRGRGRVLARIAALVTCAGAAGYAAHTGAFVVLGVMADTPDRREVQQVARALEDDPGFGLVLLLFLTGLVVGPRDAVPRSGARRALPAVGPGPGHRRRRPRARPARPGRPQLDERRAAHRRTGRGRAGRAARRAPVRRHEPSFAPRPGQPAVR